MRTFALSTLRAYWEAGHADAEQPLRTWFKATEQADCNSFSDVRETFHSVDLVDCNKLVFNIKGNRYRLVCLIEFGKPNVFVLWVGTHAEYDKLDVKEL